MKSAPIPETEQERLEDLYELKVLDTPPEERFDRLTRLAATALDAKMAFVSLVDSDRQWFKSTHGVEGISETHRDVAFCAHTILEAESLVLLDATNDKRFEDNPLVTGEFGLRFYAGASVRGERGHPVGTLCVLGQNPRGSFSEKEMDLLEQIAALVERELQNHPNPKSPK